MNDTSAELLGLADLARLAAVPQRVVLRMVSVGLIEPAAADPDAPRFHIDTLVLVERVVRLRADLGVNLNACGVVLDLLDRVNALENELAHLRRDP